MNRNLKNIIAIFIVLGFYLYAIIEKALGLVDYSVKAILFNNTLLIVVLLGVMYVLNKYFLNNTLRVFIQRKETFIIYLTLGLLLLSITYLMNSIGIVTYRKWISSSYDQSIMINSIKEILDNKFYTFFLLGPFIWFNEAFGVVTRAFLLNSLWEINKNKIGCWVSIILIAMLFSLLQIDKGLPDIINVFFIVLASNILYYKFRNAIPLLIAPVLFTTIDLIAFWIYNY